MEIKFCGKLREPSFRIEVRANQAFFSLSIKIRAIKFGSNFNEILLTSEFFRIHSFTPIIVNNLIG